MCSRLNAVQRDASHRARKQVVNSPFSVKDRICPLRVTLSMSQLLQRNRDGLQKMTSVISCNVLSIGTKLSDISPVDKKIADFSSPAKEHTRTGKFGVDMEYMTLCMGLWRIQAVQKNVLPAYCPVTIWITYFFISLTSSKWCQSLLERTILNTTSSSKDVWWSIQVFLTIHDDTKASGIWVERIGRLSYIS